jgi:DNA-binding LacI/PurR family transcriptional regulator
MSWRPGIAGSRCCPAHAKSRPRGCADAFVDYIAGRVPIAWEVMHPFDMRLTDEAVAAIRSGTADVIVCCDDLMALGALQCARRRGCLYREMWPSSATMTCRSVR